MAVVLPRLISPRSIAVEVPPHFHAQLVVIARNRQIAAELLAQVANDRDIIATEAVTQPPLDPRVTGPLGRIR